jgi:Zn-dependent protease with chaperone function/Tfp pilus assembly protein PilF
VGRVVLLWVLLAGVRAFGDPAAERSFRADLEKVSADAATAWDQGNAARDAGKLADAEAAYRKAIALAPDVDHLHRRLCWVLGGQGRLADAVVECERALSLAPGSGYDKSALAKVLLVRAHGDDRDRAVTLAHEGAAALPDDAFSVEVDCTARALSIDADDFADCADHLLALAPDNVVGNYLASKVALNHGDYHRANIYLEKAKDAGLARAEYERASAIIGRYSKRHEETFTISAEDVLGTAVPVFLGWSLLLVVLLMVGNVLSGATLRSTGHLSAEGEATPRERRIRRSYRFVLLLTGLLFYVSLPLLVVFVIGAAVLALAFFDRAGGTPYIVIIGLFVIVVSTVIAVVRALFFVPAPRIGGKRIQPEDYPELNRVLAEVAEAIGTRRVDVVYLTPGTDASVTEQRSLWRAIRGAKTERILILGVGLFDGMKQRELRSVLAHEYGHFRNADVGRVLDVKGSLVTLAASLSSSRYAIFNPAWWLLRAFTRLYLVVSRGASRLQELLADRWAIRAYGSEAFVTSHRHIVRRSVEFKADLAQTVKDVLANHWSLPNLYAYEPERKDPEAIEAEIAKRLEREPTELDSHPSSRRRIEWATQLALPGDRGDPDGDQPVWRLFPDPEAIERDMTAIIRDRIGAGVGRVISGAEWDDDQPASAPS